MSDVVRPEVDILMATYNGTLYIKDQINSILYQSFKNWRLIIRDDGSSDGTLDILQHYARLDSRIIVCDDDLGNLGVFGNFMELIKLSDSKYVMLADQDDLWINDKVETSLSFIKEKERGIVPILVFANSILTDDSLTKKYGYNYNMTEPPSLHNFLFYNAGYQGSGMIFNDYLRMKIFPFFFENCLIHDYHISLVGLLLGEVHHISRPLMLYRRHESSTTLQNIDLQSRVLWFLKKKNLFVYARFSEVFECFFLSIILKKLMKRKKALIHNYLRIIDENNSIIKRLFAIYKGGFSLRESKAYLMFKLILVK